MIERDLAALGLSTGDMVCIHSALNGMGYISGGSESIISAIKNIIGSQGTLMMPTFTGGGSTYKYVTENLTCFDPDNTPATTGNLCEIFRRQPGVRRSLHPTHSVAAFGPYSRDLIIGHESSLTPFGDGTPYDHLIRENGKVLLLNINANSLMHRIQEITDWPNHYLDKIFQVEILDGGSIRTVKTAVHSPGPYSHMVFPGKGEKEVCFVHFPSYGLPFLQGEKENDIYKRMSPNVVSFLYNRYQWFMKHNIVRKGKVGFGNAILLKATPFAERIQKDMEEHHSRNHGLYERKRLKKMWETGSTNGPMPVL
nr:AAC(3) family N-acetyltransferase [uncultured Desulfobacter sp.]